MPIVPTPAAARYSAAGEPETARADAEHAALLEFLLPFDADLRHDEMPAVALDFVVRESHSTGHPPLKE